jgi:hypothetical protein
MEKEIINLLKEKSSTKQNIYKITKSVFSDVQNILQAKAKKINKKISNQQKSIHVEYSSTGKFEAQLKFSGDTLLFHMHSNVFDFPSSHSMHKTKYVKDDIMRSFCGVIHVYNFLSDSLKYSRLNDSGFLVARIFINKEKHYFVEGDKQIGFLFNDFLNQKIDLQQINAIVDVLMLYALNFDLQAPNFNDVREVSVHQILNMNNNQKIKTAKRMGYKFSFETNND